MFGTSKKTVNEVIKMADIASPSHNRKSSVDVFKTKHKQRGKTKVDHKGMPFFLFSLLIFPLIFANSTFSILFFSQNGTTLSGPSRGIWYTKLWDI